MSKRFDVSYALMNKVPGLEAIVLIDDDKAMNFIHKLAIDELKIDVATVSFTNGREAIDYLSIDKKADVPKAGLILLDINMPQMDGWEFINEYNSRLGAGDRDFVLLMVSASTDPADESRALTQPGISGFIQKPLNAQILREIISRHFN